MSSVCRQNYHSDCEAGVNRQINMHLFASYAYHSLAFYFDRDDVALPGFYGHFKKMSDQERDYAQTMMEYQNKRGGRIVLQNITKSDWDTGSGLAAMEYALTLEQKLNQSLLDLHGVALTREDTEMTHFIKSEFLPARVQRIKQVADHIANLKRVEPGLGEYLYDRKTLKHA
ncbi:soma ferritin-like [Ptychodera flava]|uniref:soma ferritin-like n=1 Tax=Ptychodera flava TaxID=63121 RepID=UPI00396AAC27